METILLQLWAAAALLIPATGDPKTVPLPETLALVEPMSQEKNAATDKWRIDLALYFWMADLEGDLSIRNVTAEADADFGDLLDHLKMAATLHVELWYKNRMGVITDLNWMDFEDEADAGPLESTVSVTMAMTEAVGAFRVTEEAVFVDLLAGLRWITLDSEVEINGVARESEGHSYLDPIVGLRFGLEAADWLLFTFRVDVGGFGVGTDMESSTTALAIFRLTPGIAAIVGYRAFGMEIVDDDSSIEVRMKGPLLAIDVGF